MESRTAEIAQLVASNQGKALDARYLAFFQCFNRGWFFEAHEVLEEYWLPQRNGPEGAFYKGLIQLAGAFVHVRKGRPQPAVALFGLARANLAAYGRRHFGLEIHDAIRLAEYWSAKVQRGDLPAAITPELNVAAEESGA